MGSSEAGMAYPLKGENEGVGSVTSHTRESLGAGCWGGGFITLGKAAPFSQGNSWGKTLL